MAEAWAIGSYHTDTIAGKIVKISTRTAAMGATTGYTMKIGAADYQVTAGKVFHLTGLMIVGTSNHITGDAVILYADNAAMTTNPVTLMALPVNTTNVVVPFLIPVGDLQVPASKYLGVYNITNGNALAISCIGYEV